MEQLPSTPVNMVMEENNANNKSYKRSQLQFMI
jgi:hypothetical protein